MSEENAYQIVTSNLSFIELLAPDPADLRPLQNIEKYIYYKLQDSTTSENYIPKWESALKDVQTLIPARTIKEYRSANITLFCH